MMESHWKYSQKQREQGKSSNNKSELINKIKKDYKQEENSHVEERANDKYKQLYKKMKAEYNALNKKYEELKNESVNSNKDNDIFKKIETVKKDNFELKKTIKELKNNIDEITQQYDKELNKSKEYNKAITNLKEEKLTLTNRYEKLKDQHDKQLEVNGNLRNIVTKYQATSYAVLETEISDLNHKLKVTEERNFIKEKEISDLKLELLKYKEFNPHFILSKLNKELKIDNVHLYHSVDNLSRKFKETLRRLFNSKFTDFASGGTETIYGYVKENDGCFVFVDLELKEYIINHHINELIPDAPVAAFLNHDDSVDIYWFYKSEELMKYDSNNIPMFNGKYKITKEKAEEVFEQLGEFNVVIITSMNGNRYRDRLRYHGVNAIWIDPFEKSPIHVRNVMRKSDIVILCVENMPHSVLDVMEENKEKYQYVINHNEEAIFNTVKSTAIRMGLINNENEN